MIYENRVTYRYRSGEWRSNVLYDTTHEIAYLILEILERYIFNYYFIFLFLLLRFL